MGVTKSASYEHPSGWLASYEITPKSIQRGHNLGHSSSITQAPPGSGDSSEQHDGAVCRAEGTLKAGLITVLHRKACSSFDRDCRPAIDPVWWTSSEGSTMSKPMADTPERRPRRRFDDDFKAQAVRLVLDEGK